MNHTFQCCFLTSWIHLHCTNKSGSKNYKFNDTLIVENRIKEERKHIFIIYLTKQQVHVDIFKNAFSSDFSKANHLFDSLLTRAFLWDNSLPLDIEQYVFNPLCSFSNNPEFIFHLLLLGCKWLFSINI